MFPGNPARKSERGVPLRRSDLDPTESPPAGPGQGPPARRDLREEGLGITLGPRRLVRAYVDPPDPTGPGTTIQGAPPRLRMYPTAVALGTDTPVRYRWCVWSTRRTLTFWEKLNGSPGASVRPSDRPGKSNARSPSPSGRWVEWTGPPGVLAPGGGPCPLRPGSWCVEPRACVNPRPMRASGVTSQVGWSYVHHAPCRTVHANTAATVAWVTGRATHAARRRRVTMPPVRPGGGPWRPCGTHRRTCGVP